MIKYGNANVLWNRIYTIGVNPDKTDKEIIEFKVLIKKLIPEGLEGFKLIDNLDNQEQDD